MAVISSVSGLFLLFLGFPGKIVNCVPYTIYVVLSMLVCCQILFPYMFNPLCSLWNFIKLHNETFFVGFLFRSSGSNLKHCFSMLSSCYFSKLYLRVLFVFTLMYQFKAEESFYFDSLHSFEICVNPLFYN